MVNSPNKVESEDEDNDLFYFESDHLAVKGNKDYSELLKTLFVLQAQQKQCIEDYEKIVCIQRSALLDPLGTVERLKQGDDFGIPTPQRIADVPNVNWGKYNVNIPLEELKQLNNNDNKNESERQRQEEYKSNSKDSRKHRAWTTEEQKRLEELLVTYPSEPVEIKRFKKIAAALGNRTTQQVCSRVQKYFLKLHKAGLPIPGRIPRSFGKLKKSHKHQRYNHYLWKPTTFFPELDIPVTMNDVEEVPGPSSNTYSAEQMSQSNYLIPSNYHEEYKKLNKSDTEHQLEMLKRVRQAKEWEIQAGEDLFQHIGFKCDFCNDEPITGTRWHCVTCTNDSTDFCTDCIVAQMYSENNHPLSHTFISLRDDKSTYSSSCSDSESSSGTIKNYDSSNECSDGRRKQDASDEENEFDEGNYGIIRGTVSVKQEGDFSQIQDTPYSYLHSISLLNEKS